jgi:hypothetical protein
MVPHRDVVVWCKNKRRLMEKSMKAVRYKYTLLKYTNAPWSYGGQSDHTFLAWALCSHPNAKSQVEQLSRFDHCRETLCCRIFDALDKKSIYSSKAPMPIDKLRLLVKIGSNSDYLPTQAKYQTMMDKWIKSALHILNIIEKEHKWSLTKAHTIKPYSYGDKVYGIVASKKWMRSPHLVSLFTLIFRFSIRKELQTPSFRRIRSYKGVMKNIKKFSGGLHGDKYKVGASLKYWDPLLRNYSKMFRGWPMKKTFNRSNYTSHAEEGINRLCKGNSSSPKLRSRFNEVVKKAI